MRVRPKHVKHTFSQNSTHVGVDSASKRLLQLAAITGQVKVFVHAINANVYARATTLAP